MTVVLKYFSTTVVYYWRNIVEYSMSKTLSPEELAEPGRRVFKRCREYRPGVVVFDMGINKAGFHRNVWVRWIDGTEGPMTTAMLKDFDSMYTALEEKFVKYTKSLEILTAPTPPI